MGLKHFCGRQGCKAIIDMDQRFCKDHQQAEADRHQEYDKTIRYTRDKTYHSFYLSKEWKQARAIAIRRDKGLCQDCLRMGRVTVFDEVHHRLPIKTHWEQRLAVDNLVCLCKVHHQRAERTLARRIERS